ncbi:MAG: RimK family alpha-L-glutamate ligase [Pirellulaceae bacterium]|jgi:ribosomal protein S6--L-glutamate ligase|nr:RimK family alpha-L-glutamate ligase [Pirellulaceae bacterium]
MRLAVLAAPDSWYLSDLQRAAGSRHEVVGVAFDRLTARLDSHGRRVTAADSPLNDFDAVVVRTMPPGSLEQVVFRMDALGVLADAGVVVINPPRAIEAAVDKYLASAKLHAAGLLTPRTLACQSLTDALAGFHELGGDVVVKPLFGGEGRGILRVHDESLAWRVFSTLAQLRSVIYLQEYLPHHGFDLRLLVLGEQVYGMRRVNPDDWRTNVSRGARPEPFVPSPGLIETARRAAAAIGAPFAGVDVLPDRNGRDFVLEVNGVPGWKALSATLHLDVAALLLEYVETLVGRRRSTGGRGPSKLDAGV